MRLKKENPNSTRKEAAFAALRVSSGLRMGNSIPSGAVNRRY